RPNRRELRPRPDISPQRRIGEHIVDEDHGRALPPLKDGLDPRRGVDQARHSAGECESRARPNQPAASLPPPRGPRPDAKGSPLMRIAGSLLLPLLALAACNGPEPASNAQAPDIASEPAPAVTNAADPMPAPAAAPAAQWKLSEGALLLASASGAPAIRIACPAPGKLLVNVPAFRAVGSEERLSFGSGGEVVALVADTNGDKARGGVTGTGELPANLAALIAGPISASYGAQTSGRHPAPPGKLASAFAGTCRPAAPAPAPPTATAAGPCFTQGTERLTNA